MWTRYVQVLHALGVTLSHIHHGLLCFSGRGSEPKRRMILTQFDYIIFFIVTLCTDTWSTLNIVSVLGNKSSRKCLHDACINSLLSPISSENKPKNGGICVANHTSPIDVIILASDGCYAMVTTLLPSRKRHWHWSLFPGQLLVCWNDISHRDRCVDVYMFVCVVVCQVGQIHGGLMGVIQRSMVKACPHVWFERSEVKDRHLVAKR